ncbi:MAG: hypothetical protein JNL79_21765 [Myxococcales bacterium]|nr:hypothetical protein [Myxococcales bacterium]
MRTTAWVVVGVLGCGQSAQPEAIDAAQDSLLEVATDADAAVDASKPTLQVRWALPVSMDRLTSIGAGQAGGVLLVGTGPGLGKDLLGTKIDASRDDAFVALVDVDGRLVRTRALGGTTVEIGVGGAVDTDGSVFVSLRTPLAGETLGPGCLPVLTSNPDSLTLVHLGPDLACLLVDNWLALGGGFAEPGYNAAVFAPSAGTLFMGFRGSSMTIKGKTQGPLLASAIDRSGGALKWTLTLPPDDPVACKASGACVFGAQSMAAVPGGVVVGSGSDSVTGAKYALALSKVASDGKPVWTKRLRCAVEGGCEVGGSERPTIEVVGDSAGNAFITARFTGRLAVFGTTLDAGANQATFVAKIDPSGEALWVRLLRSTGTVAASLGSNGVSLDGSGNLAVAVQFATALDLDGRTVATGATESTALVLFDAAGTVMDAPVIGGPDLTQGIGVAPAPDGFYFAVVTAKGAALRGTTIPSGYALGRLRLQ